MSFMSNSKVTTHREQTLNLYLRYIHVYIYVVTGAWGEGFGSAARRGAWEMLMQCLLVKLSVDSNRNVFVEKSEL